MPYAHITTLLILFSFLEVFFDDSVRNIMTGKLMGLHTVLVNQVLEWFLSFYKSIFILTNQKYYMVIGGHSQQNKWS
jgi:hypothetical protein